MKEKNKYFQMVRGLCIIFVILIHCVSGTKYAGDSMNFHAWMLGRTAIGIAVPLFFAMSGYFSSYKKNKLFDLRLLVPFLVWSVIYGVYLVFKLGVDNVLSLKGIIKTFTGQNASHLYFVFVLLQIRLLLPIFNRYKNSTKMLCFILIMSGAWYAMYYITEVLKLIPWLSIRYADLFPTWILYWYVGYYLKNNDVLIKINKKLLITLTVVSFLVTVVESYVFNFYVDGISAVTQLKLSNVLYCLCVILLVFKCERDVTKLKLLSWLGDNSYGVYYIHYFMVFLFEKNIYTYMKTSSIFVVHIAELIFVMMGTLLIIKAIHLIFKRNISSKLFGC